jgi:serine/threonine-protein phosphatase 6 regulatory ankyrin repeat subunit B
MNRILRPLVLVSTTLVSTTLVSTTLVSTIFSLQAASSAALDASLLSEAEAGNLAQVNSLLKRGANANAANSEGNTLTALMLAARGGHSGVVKSLLQAGAKVDAKAAVPVGASGVNEGLTALMQGAASGDEATVKLLIEYKADPNAKSAYKVTDPNGATHVAGSRPTIMNSANFAILRLLVEHGADLQVKDGDGNSLLMYAAEHLDRAAVEYLLSKGLEAGERNSKGLTALDLARLAEKPANVEALEKVSR